MPNRAPIAYMVYGGQDLEITRLDILRTVTERLTHVDLQIPLLHRGHFTVQAIAPASRVFDSERADRHSLGQILVQRIAKNGSSMNLQCAPVGGVQETGASHQDRSPGSPRFVDRTHQQHGKLLKKLPMLSGHVITDKLLSDGLDLLAHAEQRLNLAFATMKR